MTSSLYDCTVMHHRLEPFSRKFVYRTFMFYLDLDEVDELAARLRLFSRNRFNLYTLRDDDHLSLGSASVRENVAAYLRGKGIELGAGKIYLLTHLRTLGHVFNPVSFYFCFDEQGRPLCAVPEVGNTFKELKPFFLGRETLADGTFRDRQVKHFYVSPFIDLDTTFDFQLRVPGERLHIQIDDYQEGRKFFLSALMGTRRPLNDSALIRSFLRIPFVTVKVITLIHYQALVLYLKRLRFIRKADNPELQREVYSWNK
jgi:DUF1365 family protein